MEVNKKPEPPQINLFQQFFIHSNPERNKELQYCLAMNVMNPVIDYIYLLTEYETDYTPYTAEQLGITSEKIIQIPLNHRMKYSDVFHFVKELNCYGYIIIANADIFFDESLKNVLHSGMNEKPQMMCQLRYEYDGHLANTKIFGNGREDSQDAWIYHSKWNPMLYHYNHIFDFQLGRAGCDNHIAYLFKICGFGLINDPEKVHILHYHKTQIRDYDPKDAIKPPYLLIMPIGCSGEIDVDMNHNALLYDYILNKLNKNERFIIPRVAGIENVTAYLSLQNIEPRYEVMKNNAGILMSDMASVKKYGEMYLDSFKNCEIYTGWDKKGGDYVYGGIRTSHEYIDNLCRTNLKVWAHCLDIFEYMHCDKIWTTALRGKKVLIVSSFIKSIKAQIEKRKIYPKELFPDCEFLFIKPPQTNGNHISLEWDRELELFNERLSKVGDYDVALVSAGGYGNLISNEIYKQGKGAIYVGGVLQTYFGIIGNRWLVEKLAPMKMFMNERWVRPLEEERPPGWQGIESAAYW